MLTNQVAAVIERVKGTRVCDLALLPSEDVQAFCTFQPSRFLDSLQFAFNQAKDHRPGAHGPRKDH